MRPAPINLAIVSGRITGDSDLEAEQIELEGVPLPIALTRGALPAAADQGDEVLIEGYLDTATSGPLAGPRAPVLVARRITVLGRE